MLKVHEPAPFVRLGFVSSCSTVALLEFVNEFTNVMCTLVDLTGVKGCLTSRMYYNDLLVLL